MHLGPFGCLTKIGAKRAELVLKFMPRSRVGIFHNERTGFIPFDPKQMFWCVSNNLGAFWTVWLPYETWCKTGQTSAKVRATKLRQNFRNEHTRSTPFVPKLMFWCISYHLGASRPFGYLTKLVVKRAELLQKFVPRSHVGIFYNESS